MPHYLLLASSWYVLAPQCGAIVSFCSCTLLLFCKRWLPSRISQCSKVMSSFLHLRRYCTHPLWTILTCFIYETQYSCIQDIGGAHLVNISTLNDDLNLLTTESFTLCFRFYLRILGTITFQKRGNVIHIPGILQLWAAYPNRSESMMIRNVIT